MILTTTLRGIEAYVASVTTTRAAGIAGVRIEGLAPAAEREARVRVQAALARCGHSIDDATLVRCDAGGLAVDGAGADLAIALSIIVGNSTALTAALGELSLNGEVRPVRGALASVEVLKRRASVVFVAKENAAEAALVDGVRVIAVRTLMDAIDFLGGDIQHAETAIRSLAVPPSAHLDMADIRGQQRARRALEIAAAGRHHLLLVGGPGTGKTMLARRLPGILPPLTRNEALDVTRVHSAAGLNVGGGLINTRPFRAPHHSTTPPGLVGGGASLPRPGEVTLAHHGVLFLDELPEFARPSLEVLREPLEAGEVVLARASGTLRYPAGALVVASMSPCPCGKFPDGRCHCAAADRARYQARVPSRLMEVFDLRVTLEPLDVAAIDRERAGEASAVIRDRVAAAHARLDAHRAAPVEVEAGAFGRLAGFVHSRHASERLLRIARTIAALDGDEQPRARHIEEALELVRDL